MNAKVTRWLLKLQEFSFDIHHIPGKLNGAADWLSRFVHVKPRVAGSKMVEIVADPEGEILSSIKEFQAKEGLEDKYEKTNSNG
ncbi:hypothetical protein ADUPG1_004305, partial [Aduncisulcus paluster]